MEKKKIEATIKGKTESDGTDAPDIPENNQRVVRDQSTAGSRKRRNGQIWKKGMEQSNANQRAKEMQI
jgi:hypothetical protein